MWIGAIIAGIIGGLIGGRFIRNPWIVTAIIAISGALGYIYIPW